MMQNGSIKTDTKLSPEAAMDQITDEHDGHTNRDYEESCYEQSGEWEL